MVTLRYAQPLQFEQRGLRLLIPTVIAPRYGDPVLDGKKMPHQVAGHGLMAEYPFEITLRLYGDLALMRVASPSHPISTAFSSGSRVVTLARESMLDRDFVLIVDQFQHDSIAVIGKDSLDENRFIALASFCPRMQQEMLGPMALKILVDCSGSMSGDSITAARRALQAVINQLGEQDRFSLSKFGSTVEHRSRTLWRVTERSRFSAEQWIGELNANLGGTEMTKALESTFSLGKTEGADVLLVTDGEIEAIDQAIAAAQSSKHRLFIVGIGSSPAEIHLRRLAEASGGACDFVAPGEAVAPAVLRMFARLRSPKMDNVRLVWEGGDDPLWTSPLSRSVFDGDTLNVFALFDSKPAGCLRLLGQSSADAEEQEIGSVFLDSEIVSGDALARLAASVRLRMLSEEKAGKMAVDYQLISERTNFLLVHVRAEEEKSEGMPVLRKVVQMMPAGWSGAGAVDTSVNAYYLPGTVSPARPRRKPRRSQGVSISQTSDAYELPAFLRRQADEKNAQHLAGQTDGTNAAGMVPISLCEFLRATPVKAWPETYQALQQIGLPETVIDWLRSYMTDSLSESVIVATFAHLMAHDDTHKVMGKRKHSRNALTALWSKLLPKLSEQSGIPVGVDAAFLERMASDLNGMTAQAWPDFVRADPGN